MHHTLIRYTMLFAYKLTMVTIVNTVVTETLCIVRTVEMGKTEDSTRHLVSLAEVSVLVLQLQCLEPGTSCVPSYSRQHAEVLIEGGRVPNYHWGPDKGGGPGQATCSAVTFQGWPPRTLFRSHTRPLGTDLEARYSEVCSSVCVCWMSTSLWTDTCRSTRYCCCGVHLPRARVLYKDISKRL
ncbi:hypothetical protein BaRGS_00019665 [Batillaria attramentaria]|uniref:Secreted protein n=1 Tax=Batillaria attramentaria TaxID=370345 RepID=A0ABD0KQ27_9CAEN